MRLHPVASSIEGGLWAERRRFNREVLIPDGERRLKEAGNFDNLRAAAGLTDDAYTGRVYQDSDLHKWLEAVGQELRPRARPRAAADGRRDDDAARGRPGRGRLPRHRLPGPAPRALVATSPGTTSSTAWAT